MSIRKQKLPITALERIDDVCAEFEREWQSGDPNSIESLLDEDFSSLERNVLLAELIVLDVDYRRRGGEAPSKREYVQRFPDNEEAINDAFNEGDNNRTSFTPPTVEQLSKLFPGLEISEMIGAGGMGAVYKARQMGLDRIVALKILPGEFDHDVKFALRFTREARTLAKLNHPNIVSVYEFGKEQDTYYFLMEYVEGSTLRDVVRAGQLSPEHALEIVPHLCDALQYAHDQGVIHRDIKPENILLSANGAVKVADFGLSRILGSGSQQPALTATHQVLGTPRYMAPEQLEGRGHIDHRADIYSLGVVIYEMLTGELPVGRFAAPSKKAEIDVRLDEVVLRTLEKEPQRRYQRASHIKSDVKSITSADFPSVAPTVAFDAKPDTRVTAPSSLEQQELAGRLLLTRRKLMKRVEASMRPMFLGHLFQILMGIGLIAIGARCWAQNVHVPHRLTCGIIVHIYGVIMIIAGVAVCVRIKKIDYSKPIDHIREKLERVRSLQVVLGPIIGFAWWLLWIPLFVAVGFDPVVVHRNSLIPSLVIGIVGMVASGWLYWRALKAGRSGESPHLAMAGHGIKAAYRELDDIERTSIR